MAVFTFVMHVRGFSSNWEALKFLAERVGYELPRARPLEGDHLAAILQRAQDVKRAAGDSDSIACIAGAVRGAYNGVETIPEEWVRDVEDSVMLLEVARGLFRARATG